MASRRNRFRAFLVTLSRGPRPAYPSGRRASCRSAGDGATLHFRRAARPCNGGAKGWHDARRYRSRSTANRRPPGRPCSSPAWTPRERDRRAILAMAGTYRVAFDFVEVASFPFEDSKAPAPKALVPYQSWSTEKVYVDRDAPDLISLVHVLDMRIVGPDGSVSDPIVTKHWRQEWTYQPAAIVDYLGNERWRRRPVGEAERRGAWLQTVLQVDESPRYASIGRWQHTASFSTWIGGDTWRPLPRREWTVRSDYQVLLGTNRHTILPTGWLQEENNLKAVVTKDRVIDPAHPYVGREYGLARYERISDGDFAAGDHYYEATKAFWQRVEDRWNSDFAKEVTVALRGQVDQKNFFVPLFERAERIENEGPSPDDDAAIRAALDGMHDRPR